MIYNNTFQLNTIGAPIFSDIRSMAHAIRLSPKLIFYLSNDSHDGRYIDFEIPKRNGETRKISAPCYSLKILQRWVLEEILYKVKVSSYSYGFIKHHKLNAWDAKNTSKISNSPIKEVASKHIKNLFVLKMDLKDFYPSIKRERIFSQFLKIGYGSYASSLLTEICTHEGVLPQGAVTSPYLSNIVCYHMDMRIAGYCNKRGITYTRYADDMIFSSDDRSSLRSILKMVSMIVEEEGFSVNERKTKFLSPKGRKEVLGLILNSENNPLIPRELKRKVRSMIHYQIISGDYTGYSKVLGYISYIISVEPEYKEKIKVYLEKFQSDRITLFSDAVKEFNEHKYFKDISDMKIQNENEFVAKNSKHSTIKDTIEFEDVVNDIYHDRENFIHDRQKIHGQTNKKVEFNPQ